MAANHSDKAVLGEGLDDLVHFRTGEPVNAGDETDRTSNLMLKTSVDKMDRAAKLQ
jgi:hypothetical protein